MLELLFYYAGGVFLFSILVILNIIIIYYILIGIQKLSNKIRTLSFMFIALEKATYQEKKLANDLYMSFYEGNKSYSEKYFKK